MSQEAMSQEVHAEDSETMSQEVKKGSCSISCRCSDSIPAGVASEVQQKKQSSKENNSSSIGLWCLIAIVFFSIPFAGFRFVTFIFFTTYDMQCLIIQHASVIDCSHKTIVPNPELWMLLWMLSSLLSSIIFSLIVQFGCSENLKLNKVAEKAKKVYKKGSFASLTILAILTFIFYAIRISESPAGISMGTSICLTLWPFVMLFVVWRFNYLPRVHWKSDDPCCRSCCKNVLFFFYWIALVMYLLETTVKLISVALDVAYDLAPVLERHFKDESLKGYFVLLIGFRLAFHTRMAFFFWQKIFHGEKDLFSEPCAKLRDDCPCENSPQTTSTIQIG